MALGCHNMVHETSQSKEWYTIEQGDAMLILPQGDTIVLLGRDWQKMTQFDLVQRTARVDGKPIYVQDWCELLSVGHDDLPGTQRYSPATDLTKGSELKHSRINSNVDFVAIRMLAGDVLLFEDWCPWYSVAKVDEEWVYEEGHRNDVQVRTAGKIA